MADEKNLVDVYASIYNKKEDLNEGLGSVIANAGAGVVGTMIGNKLSGKGKEDKKEEERRGGGQLTNNPNDKSPMGLKNSYQAVYDKELSEVVAPPNQNLERRIDNLEKEKMSPAQRVIKTLGGGKVYANKTNEDVAITHLDGSTTEIVDVVKPEALGDADSKLASRLWDQVAANLDTLGEMHGASFDVFELEEKKEKKLDPVGEEDEDVDNDGDVDDSDSYIKNKREKIGKAMGKKNGKKKDEDMKEEAEQIDEVDCWDTHKKVGMKKKGNKMVNDCRPKNESFNVKSPVVFSKPSEKVVEESISEETFEKHASSISRAHRAIKK